MCHHSIHLHTIEATDISQPVVTSNGTFQTVTFYMENGSTFTVYAYYYGDDPQVMPEMKRKPPSLVPLRRVEDAPRQLNLPGIEEI